LRDLRHQGAPVLKPKTDGKKVQREKHRSAEEDQEALLILR
jgi:hypothetical protein